MYMHTYIHTYMYIYTYTPAFLAFGCRCFFYNHRKHSKITSFLIFSRSIEKEQWHEMS